MGDWDYAELDQSAHCFSDLMGESHNATWVVRDLTGELVLLWEDPPSYAWRIGPLYADHLPQDGDLSASISEAGLHLDVGAIQSAVTELPSAPGPDKAARLVRRHKIVAPPVPDEVIAGLTGVAAGGHFGRSGSPTAAFEK